jgi:excisionase family DNA binding protein
MISPEDLMTAAEIGERLGVTAGTVLKWHRDGRIPCRKLSHKVLRFRLSEVVEALESHENGSDER